MGGITDIVKNFMSAKKAETEKPKPVVNVTQVKGPDVCEIHIIGSAAFIEKIMGV